jgi:DNA replication ATP-dependent helicase Dna2
MWFFRTRGRTPGLTTAVLDRMMDREILALYHFLKNLLDQPIEEARHSGEILGPMTLAGSESGHPCLETRAYYARFRRGDSIQIRTPSSPSKTDQICDAVVREVCYPSAGVIRVIVEELSLFRDAAFHGPKSRVELEPKKDYFLYPADTVPLLRRVRAAMNTQAAALEVSRSSPRLAARRAGSPYLEQLNSSQQEALQFLCDLRSDGAVQGPPGTGKTHLLRSLVYHALECGLTVGLAAFTHAAVDNALSRIVPLDPHGRFCRIGYRDKVNVEKFPAEWIKTRLFGSFFEVRGGEHRLRAATTHSWALNKYAPTVDLLILDEAAQIPIYFAPSLLNKGSKIVCLGDHQQLPPIFQAQHDGIPHADIFSYFLTQETPMLTVQYRMNESIQAWPSEQFYDNRLTAHHLNATRDVLHSSHHRHAGIGDGALQLRAHSEPGNRYGNPGEARLVAN